MKESLLKDKKLTKIGLIRIGDNCIIAVNLHRERVCSRMV